MSAENLLNSFLETTVETAELNSEFLLCPEMEDVPVTVKDSTFRIGTYVGKADGEEKIWANLSLQYVVDSAEAREAVKRDEVIVYGAPIFLTIDPETMQLDPDNNQALARTLKVFGLTVEPGMSVKEIFDSFIGGYCIAKITHRAMENKEGAILDEEGNQRYSAEVSAIGKA